MEKEKMRKKWEEKNKENWEETDSNNNNKFTQGTYSVKELELGQLLTNILFFTAEIPRHSLIVDETGKQQQ